MNKKATLEILGEMMAEMVTEAFPKDTLTYFSGPRWRDPRRKAYKRIEVLREAVEFIEREA